MFGVRSILVTGANQGQPRNAHRAPAGDDTRRNCAWVNNADFVWNATNIWPGSRKLPAAEEARAKFAPDIHPSSAVVPVQLDITDDVSVKNARAFIAHAGLGAPTFEETYAVNVFGTAKITNAIRPILKNGGAIVNISSNLGSMTLWSTRPALFPTNYLLYSSSKAALNSLTVHYLEAGGSPADGCKVIVKEALAKEGFRVHSQGWRISVVRSIGDVDVVLYHRP
ncbi:hypothetical protein B0H13DRAFT_1884041 [Mycena leptocephala]|nr:hypothetical protein B0H13DRAFT_1884041 [Mycena leptocephala]